MPHDKFWIDGFYRHKKYADEDDDFLFCKSNSFRLFICPRLGRILILLLTIICGFLLISQLSADSQSIIGFDQYDFNQSYIFELMNDMCDHFESDLLSGDLCNRLCYNRRWSIYDFSSTNKIVITLILGGQKIVLKSTNPFFDNFDMLDDRVKVDEFTDKVLEMTNHHLELGWPLDYKKHLIEALWPLLTRNGNLSLADRRSLWTLVSQEEFLIYRVMPLSRVFPKVMGNCGHFYAVEFVVPFRMKSYYTNLKAKILVHMMGTLKLFYEFLNQPLHWCDVKFDNFGLSSDYPKRFMIIDADMIFTESRMKHFLQSIKCVKDEDCEFFDCHALCNRASGFCTDRINTNLDVSSGCSYSMFLYIPFFSPFRVFCTKLVSHLFGTFWTKSNRYLAACNDKSMNASERLADLRLVWSWSLSDV